MRQIVQWVSSSFSSSSSSIGFSVDDGGGDETASLDVFVEDDDDDDTTVVLSFVIFCVGVLVLVSQREILWLSSEIDKYDEDTSPAAPAKSNRFVGQ